jgi:hypothetical protein
VASSVPLADPPLHPRLKLAALWTSVLFLMISADYFELYLPYKLPSMLEGRMGPLGPVTEGVMVGVTVLMSVPSVLVALSLLLPAALARWMNLILAAAYIAITVMVIQGAWRFYVLFGVLEIALLAAVMVLAWRWPRSVGGNIAT